MRRASREKDAARPGTSWYMLLLPASTFDGEPQIKFNPSAEEAEDTGLESALNWPCTGTLLRHIQLS